MSFALLAVVAMSCKHVETKKCDATCKDSTKTCVDSTKTAVDTVKTVQ